MMDYKAFNGDDSILEPEWAEWAAREDHGRCLTDCKTREDDYAFIAENVEFLTAIKKAFPHLQKMLDAAPSPIAITYIQDFLTGLSLMVCGCQSFVREGRKALEQEEQN